MSLLTGFGEQLPLDLEIIIPVLNATGDMVIGTIDVESSRPNALDCAIQAGLEECLEVVRFLWE